MSVFDLKDVAEKAVAGHRRHEVHLGGLVAPLIPISLRHLSHCIVHGLLADADRSFLNGASITERQLEVLPERLNMRILLLELIDAHRVRNRLDQAACWAGRNDVKWLQPQFKLVRLEY